MLSAKTAQCQLLRTNRFEALLTSVDLESECDYFTSSNTDTSLKTAGRDKPPKPDKLFTGTKQLRGKRRQLKRGGTDIQNIEYTEICKAIRWRMPEEILTYNKEKQLQPSKPIKV